MGGVIRMGGCPEPLAGERRVDAGDVAGRGRRSVDEPPAEPIGLGRRLGLLPAFIVLFEREASGQVRGLGTVGPIELPGEAGSLLEDGLLQRIAGREVGPPGFEAGPERGLVLAGQDQGLGVESMLDRIHP
jgi:hypothetical protein